MHQSKTGCGMQCNNCRHWIVDLKTMKDYDIRVFMKKNLKNIHFQIQTRIRHYDTPHKQYTNNIFFNLNLQPQMKKFAFRGNLPEKSKNEYPANINHRNTLPAIIEKCDAITGIRTRVRGLGSHCPAAGLLSHICKCRMICCFLYQINLVL